MSNNNISNKDYKSFLLLLKVMPAIMALSMFIYNILLIFDIKIIIIESIAGSSILSAILIYKLICVFRYCIIQKLLLLYSMLVNVFAIFPVEGEASIFHLLSFVLGIILMITLIKKLSQ